MNERFWRTVFVTAAIFNWIVGASLAFDSGAIAAKMGLELVPYHSFYSPLIGWFVILFGMLYFAVSRDLANRPIALIGAIGKAGVGVIVLADWWLGVAPASLALLVVIDLVYVVLFAWFLLSRPPA